MIPFIHPPFVWLADKIGAAPDELKLIFSFLLSYPLSGLLKRVPDAKPEQKNLFIIGVAIFYLVGLFDLWDGLRTICISASGIYAIAYYLRGSPYMPWVGFVFAMVHMSVNQLHRQFEGGAAAVDITGAQMVMVIKLTAFCWNVADGVLPDDQLTAHQLDRRLKELPGLLDYAGYVLYFPSLLVGPAFDFAEYRRWLDCTMFDLPAQVDAAKRPPTRKKRKIPRSGTPAMWKMAAGLSWIFLFVQLSGAYNVPLLTGPAYMEYGFFRRVWLLHVVGFTARLKYYGVWTLTEGACILAGLGYNGVDPATGKVSWDRLQNINPWGVESAQNTRAYLENWNMNTNKWLRNYIYLRVTPRGKRPGFRASMATFVTSAVWHGFYPGYYMTFILASFIQTAAKNMRRHFRPFFIDPVTQKPTSYKVYYDIASYLTTQAAFSFTITPFLVLTFPGSVQVWARVYFYAVAGTAALIALFASPARPLLKRKIEARAARAAGAGPAAVDGSGPGPEPSREMLNRTVSADSMLGRQPVLGVSDDLEREIDEVVEEMRLKKGEDEGRKKAVAQGGLSG